MKHQRKESSMKKRIICGILSVMMIVALCVPALADTVEDLVDEPVLLENLEETAEPEIENVGESEAPADAEEVSPEEDPAIENAFEDAEPDYENTEEETVDDNTSEEETVSEETAEEESETPSQEETAEEDTASEVEEETEDTDSSEETADETPAEEPVGEETETSEEEAEDEEELEAEEETVAEEAKDAVDKSNPYYTINGEEYQFTHIDEVFEKTIEANKGDNPSANQGQVPVNVVLYNCNWDITGSKYLESSPVVYTCATGDGFYFKDVTMTFNGGTNNVIKLRMRDVGGISITYNNVNFTGLNCNQGQDNQFSPISFTYNGCNFTSGFAYQGDCVGNLTFNNCTNIGRVNANNTSANGYSLSITNCTFADTCNSALYGGSWTENNRIGYGALVYGNGFTNVTFSGNTWENGAETITWWNETDPHNSPADVYVNSYSQGWSRNMDGNAKNWEPTDKCVTSVSGMPEGSGTVLLYAAKYDPKAPYTVKYLEKDTGEEVHPEKPGKEVSLGTEISENAVVVPGYVLSGDESSKKQSITIEEETEDFKNQIVFYYVKANNPIINPVPAEHDIDKSKTATNLNEKFETEITLSIPGVETPLVSDIVFVVDKSSDKNESFKAAVEMLKDLNAAVAETEAKIKIGGVLFSGRADKVIGLEELSDASIENLKTVLTNKDGLSGGSNLDAGLKAGKALLDADTGVEDSRKHLIVISDGLVYVWDENGTPTSISYINADGIDLWRGALAEIECAHSEGYGFAPSSWKAYFESPEMATKINNSVNEHSSLYDRSQPVPQFGNNYADPTTKDTYACSFEVAAYKTYNTYSSIVNAGYNCYVIPKDPYGYKCGYSFMQELSAITGGVVDFTEIKKDILYAIDKGSTIYDYMGYRSEDDASKFSKAYDLDFQIDKPITLYVGEKAYDAEYLGENTYGFADGKYELTYYPADGNEEHFVLKFNVPVTQFERVQLKYTEKLMNPVYEGGSYGSYDSDGSRYGEVEENLYTNTCAILYPVDSKGVASDGEYFPMPAVSYEMPSVSATVTKVWDDENYEDQRPESVTVQLIRNTDDPEEVELIGEPVELTAADNWTYTWTDLDAKCKDYTYEYSIDELEDGAVGERYVPSVETSFDAENAKFEIVLTNKYLPEPKDNVLMTFTAEKVWDDENHEDERPESIEVQLYVDEGLTGEFVKSGDPVELSDANDWTYTWKDLVKESAEEVKYDYKVEEILVPGYTSIIDEAEISTPNDRVFTITNTYFESGNTEKVISATVTKVWDDAGFEKKRPESIKIQLLMDGEEYDDPVELSADNNWTYTWEELYKITSDGVVHNYEVTEVESRYYSVEYKVKENGDNLEFTVINTFREEVDPVPVPP
ncbi:MAG: Cna B-type domain-containing protein, partial [Clostridia bacterium]|nr:Cna B-type domain-containing protein [Clostridia bacterium]